LSEYLKFGISGRLRLFSASLELRYPTLEDVTRLGVQRGAGGEIPGQSDSKAPARISRSSSFGRVEEELRTES
jgi:hypothetical protein